MAGCWSAWAVSFAVLDAKQLTFRLSSYWRSTPEWLIAWIHYRMNEAYP